VATDGKALEQRATLSQRLAGVPTSQAVDRTLRALMRLGTGVDTDTYSVGLEGLPVDEARMVVADQHRPLITGQSA